MRGRMRRVAYAAMVFGLIGGWCGPASAAEEMGVPPGEPTMCEGKNALLVAEAASTEQEGSGPASEGEIQERGLAPKGQPIPQVKGAVIQGNRVTALPGYEFVRGAGKTVYLQQIGGGGLGKIGFRCACFNDKSCPVEIIGQKVKCGQIDCSGGCFLTTASKPSQSSIPTSPPILPGVKPPLAPLPEGKTP